MTMRRLALHRVAAQRGDVRVAPVPDQQPQNQRAQHVALVGGVAAAVFNRRLKFLWKAEARP